MPSSLPETGGRDRRIGLLRMAFDQAGDEILSQIGHSHPELRRAHLRLFRESGINGSTTAELAAHAGMTKQSMHELVVHLERCGYLIRGSAPANVRIKVLRLTAKGRQLEKEVHAAVADVHRSWEQRLGSQRYDDLWATLREITAPPAR